MSLAMENLQLQYLLLLSSNPNRMKQTLLKLPFGGDRPAHMLDSPHSGYP